MATDGTNACWYPYLLIFSDRAKENASMRMSTLGLLCCLVWTGSQDWGLACTVFRVTQGARTLVGNNEDDNTSDTKVWFLAPEDGKYGRVFFGFANGAPQGGMNDQGLFFDWVADNPSPEWQRDPKKLNYAGSVSEKILEEARTLEEALQLYEEYNETAFLKSRTLLVDKSGASAIVSWQDGKMKVVRGEAVFQGLGYGYSTAAETFDKPTDVTIERVGSVLQSCLQSGEYPTQYSNVYDLQRGDVWVYRFHSQKPPVKFNLGEEIRKGHHYLNLPLLEEQLSQPLRTDFKTQPVGKIDQRVYEMCTGQYKIEPDYVFRITTRNGRLYFDAHDASNTELYPASGTRFFLRSLDGYLLFKITDDGKVEEAVLHTPRGDPVAKRIH